MAASLLRRLGVAGWAGLGAVAAGLALALFPPAALAPAAAKAAALAVAAIGLLATSALPSHVTVLAFFLLCMLWGVAPAGVVFSGFASTAFWLVFSGLVIGLAVKRTGLGARLARTVARVFPTSYFGLVAGITAVALLLTFLMPSSMSRIVLLLPIALALADMYGLEPGSAARTGIVMVTVYGATVPGFTILPANVPNVVLIGLAEQLYGAPPVYGEYLLVHFPVLGLLKAILIPFVVAWMFPGETTPPTAGAHASSGRLTPSETWLALVLATALGFWVTDFVHHISPAWIGLAAAVLCLMPPAPLVPRDAFTREIDHGSLFFIAGVLGLGAVVSHTGLGDAVARFLVDVVSPAPGEDARNFAGIVGAAMGVGLATTLPGVPIVMTPLAEPLAAAAGLTLGAVLTMQAVAFSTPVLPYQVPPLLIGPQMGGVPAIQSTRFCLGMAAMTVAVLLPLDLLWWKLLGMFTAP